MEVVELVDSEDGVEESKGGDAEDSKAVEVKSDAAAPSRMAALAASKINIWVEKYRPSSLDDLVAHDDIISICKLIAC
jgi:hypothetical protein